MIFRYPDKFIVPVDLFKVRKTIHDEKININENKEIIKNDNTIDMAKIKYQYEIDKKMWKKFDNYYSRDETGTIDILNEN